MYEAYWQFRNKPFAAGIDTRSYYPAEAHHAALLKLRYAVENRRGAALLVGPAGCGKTMLVRLLGEQLDENYKPFLHVVFPQMPAADLMAYIAAELAPAASSGARDNTLDGSVRQIQRCVTEVSARGGHTVVAIDEAHLLDGGRMFEALRLLLNFETEAGPALTLLMVGQTALVPMLERMPHFEERLAVKCLLRPFTVEETMAYVQHHTALAGAERTIFEPAASEALHRLTHGHARQINRLCDLALLMGFAEEHATITADQIETVGAELAEFAAA